MINEVGSVCSDCKYFAACGSYYRTEPCNGKEKQEVENAFLQIGTKMRKEGYEINKMLMLSTAHLTKQTADMMDMKLIENPRVYQKDGYGWFVLVTSWNDDYEIVKNIPEDLRKCLGFAESVGSDWICFDPDIEENNVLPVYEWE